MSSDKSTKRNYNEKEIGPLIQRATELHEKAQVSSEQGLSLEEAEHIAAELGLPPEYMRTAAREMGDQDSTSSFRLIGSPFVIKQTRVVDEAMTLEQWAQIVMEIRAITGKKGHIDEIGSLREWTHFIGEGDAGINFVKTRLVVHPDEDATSIQVQKDYKGFVAVLYALPLILSVFLLFVLLSEPFDMMKLVLASGMGLGAFGIARAVMGAWTKRQREKLNRLTNKIQEVLSPTSDPIEVKEPSKGSIDLPELEEEEQSTSQVKKGLRV